jgi:hypothetical protein
VSGKVGCNTDILFVGTSQRLLQPYVAFPSWGDQLEEIECVHRSTEWKEHV